MNRHIARRPPDLPASIEEETTLNFYRWELRGRGWAVWDRPVGLEPPFRPFAPVERRARVEDDGRREDIFSSIVTGLQMLLGGRTPRRGEDAEEPEILDAVDPDAFPDEDDSPLWEIEATLPGSLRVSHSFASHFLIALTYCRRPLGFEVVGLESGIVVQFVCREEDRFPLKEQLAAYFPEAVLRERQGFLARHWNEDEEGEAVVVDFGLSQEFVRPLKTYGGFDTDPLIPVVGALSNLREGEAGVLQVLFAPVRFPWAESVLRSVTDGAGGSAFSNAPEMVALARAKVSQPLYAAVVRLAAKSRSEERAWGVVKALGGAMVQFANPDVNELAPLNNDSYPYGDHEEDLLERRSRRSGMLLNSEELVSLVHLPSASVRSPKLKRQSEKTKAAPSIALGHELVLGENEHDGETRTASLSVDQRVRHMHAIGTPGTGKSTFLLNMALQDVERGRGLAVLDPHGDLIDQIVERVPENRYGDVILLDPSDEEYPIGFNILSAHSEMEKHLISSDLVAVFKRLSTSWGDQMTSVLGNAILAFLESSRGGTLADLRRFLVEKEYRSEFLTTVDDTEIVYYWEKEFPLLTGRPQAPLLTRLDTFLRPKLIRHMVAQKENRLDFADIMNGRKILLAKLSQGAIGEENAYLLGTLLVAKFHQLALARQDMRAADREPFFLYVDEFHDFVTPSMASILAGARKYRLGLVLAHQEMRQIKNEEVTAAVLANPYTRVCFRLGDQDAGKLAEGFAFFEAADLRNLGTGEAICRIERADYDFNMTTSPLPPVDEAVAEERTRIIRQLSRQRYGTPRENVVEELERRMRPPGEKGGPASGEERTDARRGRGRSKAEPEESSPAQGEEESKVAGEPVPDGAPAHEDAGTEAGATLRPAESVDPGDAEEGAAEPSVSEASSPYAAASPDAELRKEAVPDEAKSEPGPAIPDPRPAPTLGRGGADHKRLQQLVKLRAEGLGWKASIEKPVLGGAGSVDVVLERDGHEIACEICATSPVEREVANVSKCLKAGFARVVSVSEDRKRLAEIRREAEKTFSAKDLEKVRFLSPDELFELVEELTAKTAGRARRTRGYDVTTTFAPLAGDEKKAKKKTLGEALVGSIDELRERREKLRRAGADEDAPKRPTKGPRKEAKVKGGGKTGADGGCKGEGTGEGDGTPES